MHEYCTVLMSASRAMIYHILQNLPVQFTLTHTMVYQDSSRLFMSSTAACIKPALLMNTPAMHGWQTIYH